MTNNKAFVCTMVLFLVRSKDVTVIRVRIDQFVNYLASCKLLYNMIFFYTLTELYSHLGAEEFERKNKKGLPSNSRTLHRFRAISERALQAYVYISN